MHAKVFFVLDSKYTRLFPSVNSDCEFIRQLQISNTIHPQDKYNAKYKSSESHRCYHPLEIDCVNGLVDTRHS